MSPLISNEGIGGCHHNVIVRSSRRDMVGGQDWWTTQRLGISRWAMGAGVACLMLTAWPGLAHAGKQVGEDSAYAREMGFETRLYYVADGSDGAGQIEYLCEAFPGMFANDDLTASLWKVRKFYYDTSDRLTRISFAGDDDAFNQACASRTSLNYD